MMRNSQGKPYVVGIMGGVGSGKSELLNHLRKKYDAKVFEADSIARDCMLPGTKCMNQIRQSFPDCLFDEDGSIRKNEMSDYIFREPDARKQINQIVHPTVISYILEEISKLQPGDFAVIESAIMLEAELDQYCDELWYVYTKQELRCERLAKSRGYSIEKTKAIMDSQCSEMEYKNKADVILNNNYELKDLIRQVDGLLKTRER